MLPGGVTAGPHFSAVGGGGGNGTGSLSQVLIHIKAAPATAAPGGTGGQWGEEGVSHPVGRHDAPLVHENGVEAHVRVEGRGGGLVQLGEAQAAQVQGAADGDPWGRGIGGGRGQEGGGDTLAHGGCLHAEEAVGGGRSGARGQMLAVLRDVVMLLEQRGVGVQATGDTVEPSLHLQFLNSRRKQWSIFTCKLRHGNVLLLSKDKSNDRRPSSSIQRPSLHFNNTYVLGSRFDLLQQIQFGFVGLLQKLCANRSYVTCVRAGSNLPLNPYLQFSILWIIIPIPL